MVTYKSTGAAGKIYRSTVGKKYLPAKMMYGENMASGYDAQTETGAELALLPDYNDGMTKLRINGKTEQEGEPSPDNPSQMTDFTGGEVVCRGKNLFDKDKEKYKVSIHSGTVTSTSSYYTIFIDVENISNFIISTTISSNMHCGLCDSIEVGSEIYNYKHFDASQSRKITNNTHRYVGIAIYYTHSEWFDSIQIEEGSTATEYQPYITPITAQIQDTLRKVGDVCDYIEVSDRAVKKYQNIGVISFDSEDTINRIGFVESSGVFYVRNTGALSFSSGGYVISTHFMNSAELPSGTEKPYVVTVSNIIRFYNCTAVYPTLDDFKAFLTAENAKGTPVTVCYILSTPIVTDITDTETGQALLGMNTEYGKNKFLTITDSSITVTQCKMNTCSI